MIWSILIAIAIGLPRPLGYKSQAYQAIAHLYVGGAATAWFITRHPLWLWIVISLSILEVACFFYFRLRKS